MDATVAELVERASELVVPGERRILGLVGAPGAGKSTLATQLVNSLGPRAAVLVPMDGFHLAGGVLADLGSLDRKGAPDTFDDDGYARLIEALHRQRAGVVYAPKFDRMLEEPIGSAIPVRSEVPLVITEGNYLLLDDGAWPAARRRMDEVWFLDPDPGVRRERLTRRHEEFGKSSQEAALWASGPDERNSVLVRSTAARADLVLRLL
ncbi:MAG: nucleoside/nucleotide kinase family protein [Rhodococcus sp. (in: high G+C Gram-positive bacteria)]